MKLKKEDRVIQSDIVGREINFSIDVEDSLIFEMLRSKIYSDPMAAVVREISSNARDANNEVGNPEPIQIFLPNRNSPYLVIKDHGPGISPERMENFFAVYSRSTKRNTDTQIGGFGLGSKTPFALTNTFTISSHIDKVNYNYICFIDESGRGKVTCLDPVPSDEPNGTAVRIPIEANRFGECETKALYYTRFWPVPPNFPGRYGEVKSLSTLISGERWCIFDGSPDCQYLVDGIPYRSQKRSNVKDFVYKLKTGEVTLTTNREDLQYDKDTLKCLEDIDKEFVKEFHGKIQEGLAGLPSIVAVFQFINRLKANYSLDSLIDKLNWKWDKLKFAYPGEKTDFISVCRDSYGRQRRYYYNFSPSFISTELVIINDLDILEYDKTEYNSSTVLFSPAAKLSLNRYLKKENVSTATIINNKKFFPAFEEWKKAGGKTILLSEIKQHKVPRAKRLTNVTLYTSDQAQKIKIEDNTTNYVYEESEHTKSYGSHYYRQDIFQPFGVVYCKIKKNMTARIKQNPLFTPLQTWLDSVIYANCPKETCIKIAVSASFANQDFDLYKIAAEKQNYKLENYKKHTQYFPLIDWLVKNGKLSITTEVNKVTESVSKKYPLIDHAPKYGRNQGEWSNYVKWIDLLDERGISLTWLKDPNNTFKVKS